MRAQVLLRSAVAADADALVTLWDTVMRHVNRDQQLEDIRQVIDRISAMPEERIVVAEVDERVVGAVHLRATTLSPINLEPVVQANSPHVLADYRRHGIGTSLMGAAVAFAEELGIGCVGTAVSRGARDSNRFMARLALGPAATYRLAPTMSIKGRLGPSRPAVLGRVGSRHLTQVLAARRSMRRTSSTG